MKGRYDVNNKFAHNKKLFIVFVLSFLLIVIFALSPVFNIKKIKVSNSGKYNTEDIDVLLNKFVGVNGFFADVTNLKFYKIEEMVAFERPYLTDINVSYVFPNTIKIDATERKAILITEQSGLFFYIDSLGYVVETSTDLTSISLPIVKGLDISCVKIGMPSVAQYDTRYKITLRMCNLMNGLGISSDCIDIIDVTDYNNIWMYSADSSLSIKFGGEENIDLKVALLNSILKEKKYTEGILDFTVAGQPVFKENTAPTPEPTPEPTMVPPESTPEPTTTSTPMVSQTPMVPQVSPTPSVTTVPTN